MEQLCDFDGCTKPLRAKRLCAGHLNQHYKGLPLTPLKQYRSRHFTEEAPDGYAYCTKHQGYDLLEKFYTRENGTPRAMCKACTIEEHRAATLRRLEREKAA